MQVDSKIFIESSETYFIDKSKFALDKRQKRNSKQKFIETHCFNKI